MRPLVTLTTDFGTRDPYAAELKGVLLTLGPPDLAIVDLTHELPPFDVHQAALFMGAAVPRFPRGTIHLAVIDPGVGSARRGLVVKLSAFTLVGPDNGVFGYVYDGSEEVYAIDPARLAGPVSSTFHGRDVFAPVAAALARGASADELGVRIDTYEHMTFPMVDISGDVLHARVVRVDRYGNLVTNVSVTTLRGFLGEELRGGVLALAEHGVLRLVDHYAEARVGELFCLVGSGGLLELAAREDSAARLLGASVGRQLRLSRPS